MKPSSRPLPLAGRPLPTPGPTAPRAHSRLALAWVWFWYWDATRIWFVLFGGHFLLTWPLWRYGVRLQGQELQTALVLTYLAVVWWSLFDSDYRRLRLIGRDSQRRPLLPADKKPPSSR